SSRAIWTTLKASSPISLAHNDASWRPDLSQRQEEKCMEDAQALFGNPGVGFLSMLVIGALAGWIAEKVTQSDHSIFTNILVGIAGSFVCGVLASILNIPVFGFFRTLVAAIIGAILILFVWHRVHSRTSRAI